MVARATDLGVFPTVAVAIQQVCLDSRSTIRQLEAIVGGDASLAAAAIRLANSSYYRPKEGVRDLRHAVSVLGYDATRNLAMALATAERALRGGRMRRRLWLRSLRVAFVAQALGRLAPSVSAEQAFAAGLLSEVGILAFLDAGPETYAALLANVGGTLAGLDKIERAVFSYDHARLGAACGKSWGFPPPVVMAIRYHHDVPELSALTAVLAAAGLAETNDFARVPAEESAVEILDLVGSSLSAREDHVCGAVAEGLRRAAALVRHVQERADSVSVGIATRARGPTE